MPNLPIGKLGQELWFDFPVGWTATEFDRDKSDSQGPGFYRQVVISDGVEHTRGVDIVARPPAPEHRIQLIEVKDDRLRQMPAQQRHEELRKTLLRKVLGTLAGLVIAERIGEPSLHHLACVGEKPNIEAVLFLEEPAPAPVPSGGSVKKLRKLNRSAFRSDLELRLAAKLGTWGIPFYLFNLSSHPPREWTVRDEVGSASV